MLLDIARALREGFFMFWETLWPLVLGFGLAGAVQAFVSRSAMQRSLGSHRPAAVARASGYGMISSSCSYAASAMAKSLVAKGADFLSAMIFMFASTNLVIELGIVLIVLMGWQFAVSEFVGGIIMIVLLVTVGGLWLRGRSVARARERVSLQAANGPDHVHGPAGGNSGHGGHGGHGGHDGHGGPGGADQADQGRMTLRGRLRSKAGWADAASYTMADLKMLRRELVIGYLVAGLLAVLVPVAAWHALFLTGHGWWTSVENAIVGPFVAIISFVCSIGNVPLAAALWKGGISFGGVIAFLFADLITFPLLLIYRRFYGTRMMLKMLAVFWAVMSAAGLITEVIFRVAGIVPAVRPTVIAPAHFAWNYTTYLNIVFLVVFAVLYWLYRNRGRLSGNSGSVEDPVCGMRVDRANAPATANRNGHQLYFCSDRCADRFAALEMSVAEAR
jgi:uncharacterized membrane protein YraQ (UPF0718 family)/YHS domain-containing protein